MKLSILVCSVLERGNTFLPKILTQLGQQIGPNDQKVEVLCLLDNCTSMMLGDKRNHLVNMAKGQYCVFIDDDDVIADDYVITLLMAIQNNHDIDVINFIANVSLDGAPAKPCFYSLKFLIDHNKPYVYCRIPNHISCTKRELMLQTPFKNVIYGEDAAYSKELLPKLTTEHNINKTLYYYNYNSESTIKQKQL